MFVTIGRAYSPEPRAKKTAQTQRKAIPSQHQGLFQSFRIMLFPPYEKSSGVKGEEEVGSDDDHGQLPIPTPNRVPELVFVDGELDGQAEQGQEGAAKVWGAGDTGFPQDWIGEQVKERAEDDKKNINPKPDIFQTFYHRYLRFITQGRKTYGTHRRTQS